MNKINLALFTGALLLFFACDNTMHDNTVEDKNQSIALRSPVGPVLYADLQWVSFIISGMLLEDESDSFRSQFKRISESSGTVPLSELFDDPKFDSRFSELAYFYFEEEAGIDINGAIAPKNKPAKPPRGIVNEGIQATLFLAAVKSYDCTEIYFPEEITFNNLSWAITSTGHPLNTDLTNEGYLWKLSLNQGGFLNVLYVNVDNDYVDENGNIIVARLMNTITANLSDDCGFLSNNSDIDFTVFLNQE